MTQIRGFCYRVCNECEIFKAAETDDDQKRSEMARNFSEIFDQDFKPEDINCDGCKTQGGYLFKIARSCSIRNREMQSLID